MGGRAVWVGVTPTLHPNTAPAGAAPETVGRSTPPQDASGSEDLGNIDSFRLRDDGVWVAAGEWGVLEGRDLEVTLAFAR